MKNINVRTNKLLGMVSREFKRENETMSLIPSENVMSRLATKMYSSRVSNRYVIPVKIGNKLLMPGRENLGNIIGILEKKLCSIYKTKYAIADSLSGLHQMGVIISAIRKMADFIITLDKFHGGHSKTRGIALKHGFRALRMKLNPDTWDIDYDELKRIIRKMNRRRVLIYIDHTIVLSPLDMEKLLDFIPSNWIVYYDISHLQLFYFSHVFNFPTRKNFFFGGTTHKTFPGPQKAIVLLNNRVFFNLVKKEFKKTLSSVHTGSLLALLVTVMEMERFGLKYAKDIIDKTRYLANLLKSLNPVGPMPYLTNTHQICISVPDITKVTKKLASVGIITMPERVPFTKKKGLRLGIQEQCRLGITRKDLEVLAKIIISCVRNEKNNGNIRRKVLFLAKKLSSVHYS